MITSATPRVRATGFQITGIFGGWRSTPDETIVGLGEAVKAGKNGHHGGRLRGRFFVGGLFGEVFPAMV